MRLTANGCRERQDRLRAVLDARNLDGALISRRDLVYYFTGFHRNRHHASAAFIGADGKTTLVCADEPNVPAVEEVIVYDAAYFATMHSPNLRRWQRNSRPPCPLEGTSGRTSAAALPASPNSGARRSKISPPTYGV